MVETKSSAPTRERILTAASELFRRQGFNGTSLSQIVATSRSTTGSVYHFFPGGKDELTAEVLRVTGRAYGDFVEMVVRAAVDPAQGMTDAFQGAAEILATTGFIDPCPIGTIAREVASTHEPLRQVAMEVMQSWTDTLLAILTDAGIAPDEARALATLSIAAIEGGFIMARTHRSVDDWISIGESLAAAIEAKLPAAGRP